MAADTTARIHTVPPTASVTCSDASRPSHRSLELTERISSTRMASTGMSQSKSNCTSPSSRGSRRVQFSNGCVVKWLLGTIQRRSSQVRTTT